MCGFKRNVALLTILCSSLLQENTQLTVPILDALSSLNLSSSLLTEVVHIYILSFGGFIKYCWILLQRYMLLCVILL